jgi:hypothetical protein
MMTVLGGQTNVNAIFLDILQDIVENAYTTAELLVKVNLHGASGLYQYHFVGISRLLIR